jgi:hypothetical protein
LFIGLEVWCQSAFGSLVKELMLGEKKGFGKESKLKIRWSKDV